MFTGTIYVSGGRIADVIDAEEHQLCRDQAEGDRIARDRAAALRGPRATEEEAAADFAELKAMFAAKEPADRLQEVQA